MDSEIASKLLFDYFYLHVLFQSYKVMAHRNGVLSSSDYKSFQLEILKEALSRTIRDIDFSFSQASSDFIIYSKLICVTF